MIAANFTGLLHVGLWIGPVLAACAVGDSPEPIKRVFVVANCGGDEDALTPLKKAAEAFSPNVGALDVSSVMKAYENLPALDAKALVRGREGVNKAAFAIRAKLRKVMEQEPSLIVIVGDESCVPPFVLRFIYERDGREMTEHIFTDYPYSDAEGRGNYRPALVRIPQAPEAARMILERPCRVSPFESAYLCTLHTLNDRVAEVLRKKGMKRITSTRGSPVQASILAEPSMLLFQGHGGPRGYAAPISLCCQDVPTLTNTPLVILAGCSTATPGSEIVSRFLEQGAAGVLGTTSTAHGVWDCGYWPLLLDVLQKIPRGTRTPFPILLNNAKRASLKKACWGDKLKHLLDSTEASVSQQEARHLIGVLHFQYYGSPHFILSF